MSNRERIGEWASFVYLPHGGVTHVLAHSTQDRGTALCGRWPGPFRCWFGTGSQTEHDRARRMPLCIRCMEASRDRSV